MSAAVKDSNVAMITARTTVRKKQAVARILDGAHVTPSALFNAVYDYILETGELPNLDVGVRYQSGTQAKDAQAWLESMQKQACKLHGGGEGGKARGARGRGDNGCRGADSATPSMTTKQAKAARLTKGWSE